MVKKCAWCGPDTAVAGEKVTHGICVPCFRAMKSQITIRREVSVNGVDIPGPHRRSDMAALLKSARRENRKICYRWESR